MTHDKLRYHRAATLNDLEALKGISKKECDVQNSAGLTPLHAACSSGHLEAVRILLSRGSNPNKLDLYGNTPLHCASAGGFVNCVTLLLDMGANIWHYDLEQHTALQLAEICHHMAVVDVLSDVSTRQSVTNPQLTRKLKQAAQRTTRKRNKAECRRGKYSLSNLGGRKSLQMGSESRNPLVLENRRINFHPISSSPFETPRSPFMTDVQRRDPNLPPNAKRYPLPLETMFQPQEDETALNNTSASPKQPVGNWTMSGAVAKRAGKKRAQIYNGYSSVQSIFTLEPGVNMICTSTEELTRALDTPTGSSDDQLHQKGLTPLHRQTESRSQPDLSLPHLGSDSGSLKHPGLLNRPGLGSLAFFGRPDRPRIDKEEVRSSGGTLSRMFPEVDDFSRTGYVRQRAKSVCDFSTKSDEKSSSASGTLVRITSDKLNALRMDLALPPSVRNFTDSSKRETALDQPIKTLDLSSSQNSEEGLPSSMEMFLACYGLSELAPLMHQESMDLAALELCSDDDLKELKLPMGPRKKLLDGINKRRAVFANPGKMINTYL